ncbi:hypothetical protein GCM10017744_001280 [Streptomyces antimycoticus]|uniref:Uncharacterized protein n=1 Tax=Streptomyces antimycoticus TaxID=68175 RepID=A0A4D4KR77_9ACTN|nr:hypothetical protein SANT12839_098400 [Streptomyces antimycoticus]
MARRPPGAIRAQRWPARSTTRSVRQIPGIPRRTRAAINQIEAQYLGRGAVAEALHRYESFLKKPGRYLYLPWDDCPCCDPTDARDTLEDALRRLPPAARGGLREIVARLDEEFLRRTLPDPWAASVSSWHAAAWWRQRIREI